MEHRPRASHCMDAAKARERERVKRLSVEERIIEALSTRDRFAWLQPEEISRDDQSALQEISS